MSISSTSRKAGPYSGNDVATAFAFAFKVFSTADVLVVFTSALDVESELTIGTDYTVTLNSNQDSNPGGTVTLLAPLATGAKLTLASSLSNLQPVTLTNNGGFYPALINDALDRATIQIQQIAEEVSRSVKVDISSDLAPNEYLQDLADAAAEAEASAAAAAESAALAATFVPDAYVPRDSATGAARIPAGTTAQRPGTPVYGDTRANSTLGQQEWWNGTAWTPMGGGQMLGAAATKAIFFNANTIDEDLTVVTGTNGGSFGPVSVNSGRTVDIEPGAVWSIT